MLKGKHIIVGITGSIAAYKAASLVRLLVKEGAEVKVVMTELAKQFITPLTLATLSKHPVMVEFYNPENGDWHSHVDMGLWADLYLIAPATANTLGKMAHGIAVNLLLTNLFVGQMSGKGCSGDGPGYVSSSCYPTEPAHSSKLRGSGDRACCR